MVVSCSALHATSWLEPPGGRAREPGAPGSSRSAPACPPVRRRFVSGGASATSSALVWRVTRQRHAASDSSLFAAVSEEATARRRGPQHHRGRCVPVPSVDHRLTGGALPQPWQRARGRAPSVAVVATGHHERRHSIDDLPGGPPVHASATSGSRRRRVRGAPCFASVRGRFDASNRPTRSRRPAQVALRALRLLRPALPGAALAKAVPQPKSGLPRRLEGEGGTRATTPSTSHAGRAHALWFSLAVYRTNAYAEASSARSPRLLRAPSTSRPSLPRAVRRRLSDRGLPADATVPRGLQAWSTICSPAQRGFVPRHLGRHPAARLAILAPDTDMACSRHLATMAELRSAVGGPRAGGPRLADGFAAPSSLPAPQRWPHCLEHTRFARKAPGGLRHLDDVHPGERDTPATGGSSIWREESHPARVRCPGASPTASYGRSTSTSSTPGSRRAPGPPSRVALLAPAARRRPPDRHGAASRGMDVVEVSPPYDHAGVTAFLANRVVLEALSGIAWRRRHGAAKPSASRGTPCSRAADPPI